MKIFPEKAIFKNFEKHGIFELTVVAMGTAVFLLLLLIPPPPPFSSILHQLDLFTLFMLFIFFSLLFSRNGRGWEICQTVIVFGLFAVALAYKWQFAHYDGEILGGLLPWSDASGYYLAAHRLYLGLDLSPFATRRPLFTALFSVLLRLMNGNFMLTLICLTFFNALAVFFTSRIVKRIYGPVGASVFLIFAYVFYEKFTGKTMTEQFGFLTGNLALYFLLAGGHTKSLWRALAGLGLLTLALNARAGAFFILPALILWSAIYFGHKTDFLRVVGLAGIVVLTGFLLNLLLVTRIGSKNGGAFSNFPYVVYSLASGNKGWDQVIKDYPNVTEAQVMPLAVQRIRQEPGLFIRGILAAYQDYFRPLYGAFSFIDQGTQTWINIVLWGFVLAGFAKGILRRREKQSGLVLFSFIGVFASVGLAPPNILDFMRAFAATIPFTALWVAAGVSTLFAWGRNWSIQTAPDIVEETYVPYQQQVIVFSVLILFLAIPAPILQEVFAPSPSSPLKQTVCRPARELVQGFAFADSSIILIRDTDALESYIPYIRVGDFQHAIKNIITGYPFLDEELLNLKAGDRISFGLDLQTSKEIWMVSKFPIGKGEFGVCGRATDNEQLRDYNFYYLSGTKVQSSSLAILQRYPNITLIVRLIYELGLGLVFFLLIMGIFRFERNSVVNYVYTLGVMLLFVQGVSMGLYVQGKLPVPFEEQRTILQVKDATPVQGNLYALPLGTEWMSQADLGISPAMVYENGIPLARPNSLHADIMEKGNGRYSVWKGYLYFSSSDNTDPRTNGRVYEIKWPHPISPILQWISYLLSIVGIVILFFGRRGVSIRQQFNITHEKHG